MQEYISCVQNEDVEKEGFIANNHPLLKEYYEALGEDKIKALKYRKKDVEKAYSLRQLKDSKFFDVIKNLNVVSGDIITIKDAKDMLEYSYNNLELKTKVTAKTFEDYFIVENKLVTIQGKRQRAYKVLSAKNVNLLM